jgi:hypothetical protein
LVEAAKAGVTSSARMTAATLKAVRIWKSPNKNSPHGTIASHAVAHFSR